MVSRDPAGIGFGCRSSILVPSRLAQLTLLTGRTAANLDPPPATGYSIWVASRMASPLGS